MDTDQQASLFPGDLMQAVGRLAAQLKEREIHIVFAESCTGGLVSAVLATVPGISKWLCGSAVTYQEATKTCWLGVPVDTLDRYTAVSHQVASDMAAGVLRITPQAKLAVSVTGHLGPGAPQELDGTIFIGAAIRRDPRSTIRIETAPKSTDPEDTGGAGRTIERIAGQRVALAATERQQRQFEATRHVLGVALELTQVG